MTTVFSPRHWSIAEKNWSVEVFIYHANFSRTFTFARRFFPFFLLLLFHFIHFFFSSFLLFPPSLVLGNNPQIFVNNYCQNYDSSNFFLVYFKIAVSTISFSIIYFRNLCIPPSQRPCLCCS